jgi:FemAB-related protein (PEP-CTERM system-associated)
MTTMLTRPGVRSIRTVTDADAAWRETVEELGASTVAHAPEWFRAIRKGYGHEPLYLSGEDGDGRAGVLPAFIVRRPLLGTVVSSMPFLDTGGPCSASPELTHALVAHLVGEARRLGARAVELRGTERLSLDQPPLENKVNLVLPLPADPDRLWRGVGGAIRNQIRKAERSGLTVEFGHTELLGPFYDAFAVRMRDLGSPVHARGFLGAVLEAFGPRARIALVRKGHAPVGGLVALAHKDSLVIPWATCLKEYFALCPNMLMYWETLRTACREGFRRFDFGRSSRNSGTYQFKRQWGAHEEPAFWYAIPLAARANGHDSHASAAAASGGHAKGLVVKAWQRLPLPVTRWLGPRLRRYLTQ